MNAPAERSTASRSIFPRRAASTIGIGSAGACSSLNPPAPARSPANAASRKSIVSATLLSGLTSGMPFQPSTMRSEDEPMPSTKRPPDASCSAAACCASSAGPRWKMPTMPVPRRMFSVHAAAIASGVKPSGPFVSPLQRSV